MTSHHHLALSVLSLLCICGAAQAQCSGNKHEAQHTSAGIMANDIVDTAVAAGNFKTLAAALKAADLVGALKGKGPFTVFAPTDEAFAKLGNDTIQNLLKPENKAKLTSILLYHVVEGEVPSSAVKTGAAPTLSGQRIDLTAKDGKVTVDSANVIKADIKCSNGVIHVVDSVIIPSDKDIIETAVVAGQFKTLATLLEKADLIDALKGAGPFTVFAPTDDAFAKLPKEVVDNLLKTENKEQLAAILKYHVISGRVFSDAAAKGATVATLQGAKVTTKSQDGKVMVQGATVIKADLDTRNGVIHVIDSVILPPAESKSPAKGEHKPADK